MIIDDIVEKTKIRLEKTKKQKSLEAIKEEAFQKEINDEFPFEKALKKKGMSYVLEVKKASPSKGLISKDFDYIEIAKDYQQIGASAISVLTEPDFFQGSLNYLKEISENVSIPLLRKDFIIDEYMIYEAKVYGASAYLLIVSLYDEKTLKKYIEIGQSLGMSALVEAHNKQEVKQALNAKARIIGVNNRDLRTFHVDFNTSLKLRSLVHEDKVFMSESGIKDHNDITKLEDKQVDAVLIGETMMKAKDRQKTFDDLRGYDDAH